MGLDMYAFVREQPFSPEAMTDTGEGGWYGETGPGHWDGYGFDGVEPNEDGSLDIEHFVSAPDEQEHSFHWRKHCRLHWQLVRHWEQDHYREFGGELLEIGLEQLDVIEGFLLHGWPDAPGRFFWGEQWLVWCGHDDDCPQGEAPRHRKRVAVIY